uniref:Gustatory receptor 11 n=1 Tax=Sirex nitobei TaxID=1602346 RepID=A0A857N5G7_9HYME|nr:gustatory receptor 11 [Sirex nitobei]
MVLVLALIEHSLSIVNNTPTYIWQRTENVSFSHFLHVYSLKSHAFILSNWDYNIVLGIFIFIVSKIATFTWNFMDLFIMLISTGLAERYKVLNNKMTKSMSENHTVDDWRIFRECYGAMSSLVKKVDNDVSPVVLLSFANNLYFICLQLLNGISPQKDDVLSSIYFFGSFGFLVSRTIAVTLMAARIHDQSKLALPIIYTCPASTYCTETQRLQHQLTTDDIALTGLRFFSITRNFMLAVCKSFQRNKLMFNLLRYCTYTHIINCRMLLY